MSPRPLYQMVKDHILEQIDEGGLQANDRVPSETELVDALGVSRMTANRALNELTRQGVLLRRVGVGTFVADRRARGELLAVRDIADELAERGHLHTMRVRRHEHVAADNALALGFGRAPGHPLIHAVVRHYRDGEPLLLEERYVDATLIPEFIDVDLATTTSYRYLIERAPLQKVEHSVRATAATAKLRRELKLGAGEPCLSVRRRTWSGGQVASIVTLSYAGSRYEISGQFSP